MGLMSDLENWLIKVSSCHGGDWEVGPSVCVVSVTDVCLDSWWWAHLGKVWLVCVTTALSFPVAQCSPRSHPDVLENFFLLN